MIASRREFEVFRRENAEQHREVGRKIDQIHSELLARIDGVQGRVDRLARWLAGVLLSVAGAIIIVLLGSLGWAVARLLEAIGGGT